MSKEIVKEVPLELIDEPEGRVRLSIPEREIFELSESIKNVGLLQDVVLAVKGDRFEMVAGERRLLAFKLLEKPTIRAKIKKLTKQEIALIRATENLQRKDLSPVEEGAIYIDLYNEGGLTIKMIAQKMGRSASHVKQYMEIMRMDEQVQKSIHEGLISIRVAEQLERFEDKKEKYRFLEMAIENGVTSAVVRTWVDDYRKSLRFLETTEELPPPERDYIEAPVQYTSCMVCQGPLRYEDIKILKVCPDCYNEILRAMKKEGG